jgi:pimeloyl-ACP methyl ester carboxylesterase
VTGCTAWARRIVSGAASPSPGNRTFLGPQPRRGADRLFDGHLRIDAVRIVQVEVVDARAQQRGVIVPPLSYLSVMSHRVDRRTVPRDLPFCRTMEPLRTYGDAPYTVAVLHGGPGAAGSAGPIARALGQRRGVLEPMQTADSLEGQLVELHGVLTTHGRPPLTLVGWSWGAMLAYLFAARHPGLVAKLVLVSSAVFDEASAATVQPTQLGRLDEAARQEVITLRTLLADDASGTDRNAALARLAHLLDRADTYDAPAPDTEPMAVDHAINRRVWSDARPLRQSGALLELGRSIRCPVVALHGDYDPRPAEGVRAPLAAVLPDFRFVLLDRCGHKPWLEAAARDRFFQILDAEVDRVRGDTSHTLRGRVVSGLGDFSQGTERLHAHYERKTGLRLVPGTLNVQLDAPYDLPPHPLRLEAHEYGGTVSVNLFPCRIFGRRAFILRTDATEQGRGRHPRSLVEVATDVRLRDLFGLRDGDVVEIEVAT